MRSFALALILVVSAVATESLAWEEQSDRVQSDRVLNGLMKESQDWAGMDSTERSEPTTALQNSIRQYAGTFLDNMQKLPKGAKKSTLKLTSLLAKYLSSPAQHKGFLADIRDKVPKDALSVYKLLQPKLDVTKLASRIVEQLPKDGDTLLMDDTSSCGGQSTEDVFADMFEENAQPEIEFALEEQDSEAEVTALDMFEENAQPEVTALVDLPNCQDLPQDQQNGEACQNGNNDNNNEDNGDDIPNCFDTAEGC